MNLIFNCNIYHAIYVMCLLSGHLNHVFGHEFKLF